MDKIVLAQIGVGNWGKNLLRNFSALSNARVKMIAEMDETIRQRVQSTYPDIQAVAEAEKVISDNEVNAIVIATTPDTHYDLAKKALLAGKHVFVEKPMSLNARDGEELVRIAREQKKVLMVGHILEYHPGFLKMKELVDTGELGDIFYLYSTRVNLGVVRQHENALWSLAPHDISIALMLIQADPVKVVATGQSYLQNGIEDVVFTTIHFPDKKMAHLHVSWLDPHKIRKITVVGSKKMAVLDDMESSEKLRVYDKGVDFTEGYVDYNQSISLRMGDIHIPFVKMQEPLALECRHFVECIIEGKEPVSNGEDGLRVSKVLEAAQKSLMNGGIPVEIESL